MAVIAQEKDTAMNNRSDAQNNHNKDYSTIYTRSTSQDFLREMMMQEFGFWLERRTITPEMAEDILANKGRNRKIKPTVVSKYLADMKNGRWYFTPSAIWFDENGQLMDGQHRLQAVVELGRPVDFVVVYGVNRTSPVDIHKQRTTVDNLLYSGHIGDSLADGDYSSCVNAILKIKAGGAVFNTYSDYVKGDVLKKYAPYIISSKRIANAGKSHSVMRRADIRAVLVFALLKGYSEDFLYQFAKTVNTGIPASGFPAASNPNPALVLRRMIKDLKLTRAQLVSVTEQAIVDSAKGRDRTKNYNPDKGCPISGDITIQEVLHDI